MSCVLWDVDGTLFDAPSTEARFIWHLVRKLKLGPIQVAAAAWFQVRHLHDYGRHTPKKNKAYLANLKVTQIEHMAEEFVHRELLPRLRPQLRRRLEWHRERGDHMALLTGTPAFIAAPLARSLGMQLWCASQCSVNRSGRRFSARPPIRHPLGPGKLDCAHELCARLGERLDGAWAYADSVYDLKLLQAAGHPVAVTPDERLALVASSHGWEVMSRDTPSADVRFRDSH